MVGTKIEQAVDAVRKHLGELEGLSGAELGRQRYAKFRAIGVTRAAS